MEATKSKITNILNCLYTLLIVGTIIWAITQLKACSSERNAALKHCTIVGSDTVTKLVYRDKWHPAIVHDRFVEGKTIYKEIPVLIDTVEILRRFYSQYLSCDTIKTEDLLAIMYFTISENRLQKDSFVYKITRPDVETVITHTVVPQSKEKKNKLFAGFNAGCQVPTVKNFGFGPELLYVRKQTKAVGLGYDVLNKSVNAKFLISLW